MYAFLGLSQEQGPFPISTRDETSIWLVTIFTIVWQNSAWADPVTVQLQAEYDQLYLHVHATLPRPGRKS